MFRNYFNNQFWSVKQRNKYCKLSVLLLQAGDDIVVQHPADTDDVVLFSFRSKAFFGKKKVRLLPFLIKK